MLCVGDIGLDTPAALLARYGLRLQHVDADAPIPGSFWGEPEAGIIGCDVYVRDDTPVHSMLHEAGHLIVLPPDKRAAVHTDATDSVDEEDATCYLQILLAAQLPGVGSAPDGRHGQLGLHLPAGIDPRLVRAGRGKCAQLAACARPVAGVMDVPRSNAAVRTRSGSRH